MIRSVMIRKGNISITHISAGKVFHKEAVEGYLLVVKEQDESWERGTIKKLTECEVISL